MGWDNQRVQIEWAIPCRYAEQHHGETMVIGAGTDVFHPAHVPTTIEMFLALSIRVPEHELGTEEQIRVELLDPDLRARDLDPLKVLLTDYQHRPEGRHPSVIACPRLRLDIAARGQHTVHLRLQDRITPVPVFILEP